jgi:hypothetical protein
MYIFAPVACLSLLIYMISIMTHIISIAEKGKIEASTFPWIGLFKDSLSKFLINFTLFLFPLIVCLSILWQSLIGEAQKIFGIFTLTIIFFVVSSRLIIKVLKFQKILHRNEQ